MFAGAAREAVFSSAEVIRRIDADFVPVALKAHLVNNPGNDEEGRLYREIGRSKPAPQGICVANCAGKVLAWALMFDDDKSVLAFLDHSVKRFGRYPDASQPVPAERYMKFPSRKLEDVRDNGQATPIAGRHASSGTCPATPRIEPGTITARVFGRALGPDGRPVADAVRQEHYVEDRFQVAAAMQEALARTVASAGASRFRMADDLARLCVSHAYLGQLDVNPVGRGLSDPKECEFWGEKVNTGRSGPGLIRVQGKSHVAGGSRPGEGGDGRLWKHEVKLEWHGLIELEGSRMTRLLLSAQGSEKLTWGNRLGALQGDTAVAHLPAGHAIDLACEVRYGILGEPTASGEADDPASALPIERTKAAPPSTTRSF